MDGSTDKAGEYDAVPFHHTPAPLCFYWAKVINAHVGEGRVVRLCAAERQVRHFLHARGSVPTSAEYAVFYDCSGGRIGFYDPVFLAKF